MTQRRTVLLAIALVLVACDEKKDTKTEAAPAAASATVYEPALTKELVPAIAKGLVLGSATRKELEAALPVAEAVIDKRLGGNAKVEYNDAPAIQLSLAKSDAIARGTAWLVRDAGGEDRLARLELVTTQLGVCDWVRDHIGKLDGATKRPGSNRKFGAEGKLLSYTGGTADRSQPVGIECGPLQVDGVAAESLVLGIDSTSSTSMVVSREG
ncbi:MAG: hypothetical protein K1X88_12665 [Nannocystaceae bacterium]|nr:hypothetical protein [Nannocystaceae bacterium]